ncbi:MAG TPA: sigma-70 family RNA polymerase sigma factor [Terriglobales bacterium]|nr:sigma-70 family RNA polymerase sigma factor [Terriglobales bacterium]
MVARAPASERSPEQTDERLLVEAAQKDPARFAELYQTHFERVYAFIAHRVGDRATAEDLTSDVFHKALANLKRFEWRGVPFGAWLLRIAVNAIVDRSKQHGREIAVDDPPELSIQPGLGQVEDRARLFRLVDGLPADQRHVVVMRFAEQKSIREIAQHLGRTEGAVKQLQFRALENLRCGFDMAKSARPKKVVTPREEKKKSGGRNG